MKSNTHLFRRLRKGLKQLEDIKSSLKRSPLEWGLYQSAFNQELNAAYHEILLFEKDCLRRNEEEELYRLKRLFINRVRANFMYGEYTNWSFNKPLGYAGDYKIIDNIYLNRPTTNGYDRLFDNYFQMSAVSHAVRNRKNDFVELIVKRIQQLREAGVKRDLRILDLASGPARDVKEVYEKINDHQVYVDCFENDEEAIEYAKRLLNNKKVNFYKCNAVRIALKKEVQQLTPHKYDIIYSTGLFDYLDYSISVRLISNLKKLLSPDGMLAISDVHEKFSNPSVYFMEWVGDWNLIYRPAVEFRKMFLEAGFNDKKKLNYLFEQQGLMQYICAYV